MAIGKSLVFMFFLLACNQATMSNQDKTELYQHWIHSYEEDDKVKQYVTYRPSSYDFPLSRGRIGFKINPDGTFIYHPIAPFDGNLTIMMTWILKDNRLIVSGNDEGIQYEIKKLEKEKLVLKEIK